MTTTLLSPTDSAGAGPPVDLGSEPVDADPVGAGPSPATPPDSSPPPAPESLPPSRPTTGSPTRGHHRVTHQVRPSLDEALTALFRGELAECLACGERVEIEDDRVECGSCGLVLEPEPALIDGQLELL